jgi:hypothetical protein
MASAKSKRLTKWYTNEFPGDPVPPLLRSAAMRLRTGDAKRMIRAMAATVSDLNSKSMATPRPPRKTRENSNGAPQMDPTQSQLDSVKVV